MFIIDKNVLQRKIYNYFIIVTYMLSFNPILYINHYDIVIHYLFTVNITDTFFIQNSLYIIILNL